MFPRGLVGIVASGICGLLAAPAAAGGGDADPAAGRELAEVHCSRCHAAGDTGASPMQGAPPLRSLNRRYPVEQLAEALAEGIGTAHPQMPVFTFSPEEIDALLAYLGSLE